MALPLVFGEELERLRKDSNACQVLRRDAERVARERREEQAQLQSYREQVERAGEEHTQLQGEHEAAVAELERLRSIIQDGSHAAEERTTSLTLNVLKIQFHVRRFFQHQRQKRLAVEEARREKHLKVVSAMTSLQRRWRLRNEERKRRWQITDHAATPYDVILAFDSLAEFQEKKQIQFLQRAESHLQVAKEGRYRIVAVVGLFDKGKTWLLNKLFGVAWWQFLLFANRSL